MLRASVSSCVCCLTFCGFAQVPAKRSFIEALNRPYRRGGDGAAEERRTSERRHENGLYAAGRLQIRDSKVQAARRKKACYQRANLTEARTERGLQEPRRSARGYGRRSWSWRLRDGATEIEETDS